MEKEWVFNLSRLKKVPLYNEGTGYGFTDNSCAIPPRYVDSMGIKAAEQGCIIKEEDESRFILDGQGEAQSLNDEVLNAATRYNLGGMIFRVNVPAGIYKIEVETTSRREETLVAVSGLKAPAILREGYWNAAGLIPIRYPARWVENTWTYTYVNSRPYIDIEVEPRKPHIEVGIQRIKITEILEQDTGTEDKPNLFILGDSTAKSYVFEEAPMCGWGQLFGDLFNLQQVNVINYSQGGRSLKVMNFEGRFNDLLLSGKKGDYILLQSGHNDERATYEGGETARFGRGATEEMFQRFLEEIFIPSIRIRGMIPVLVTPTTRVGEGVAYDGRYHNSFVNRRFPDVMKEIARKYQIPLIDLNGRSVDYINEIGKEGAEAIVLSIEAGETPGKTNSGSFANGNPTGQIDRTHMKEALAKNYARITAEELYKLSLEVEELKPIQKYIKSEVKEAVGSGDWSKVYPEVCRDTISGTGAYYRNQIEKMVQLGVMEKDHEGYFHPKEEITVEYFKKALSKMYGLEDGILEINQKVEDSKKPLSREEMGSLLLRAYEAKFKDKPKYMTDYNGTNITPDDMGYDPNLMGEEAQYYPLAGFERLKDREEISETYQQEVRKAYNLGLIRAEAGIKRGEMKNGIYLEPKKKVTKEKAAKALYFMWVLEHDIKEENNCREPK